jgi:hypothetical protein
MLILKSVESNLFDNAHFIFIRNNPIRVITKLPNSEQSYKGKVKTHNYINRQLILVLDGTYVYIYLYIFQKATITPFKEDRSLHKSRPPAKGKSKLIII